MAPRDTADNGGGGGGRGALPAAANSSSNGDSTANSNNNDLGYLREVVDNCLSNDDATPLVRDSGQWKCWCVTVHRSAGWLTLLVLVADPTAAGALAQVQSLARA